MHNFCYSFVTPKYFLNEFNWLSLQSQSNSPMKIKDKSPVVIRMKKLRNGNKSVYLDIYHDGKRHYEFLKLYIVPVTRQNRESAVVQNKNVMQVAETMKAQRILELAQGVYGVKLCGKKVLLTEWIGVFREEKRKTNRGESGIRQIGCMARHLAQFRSGEIYLSKIDKQFCEDFLDYLRNARNTDGQPLSKATTSLYFKYFKMMLKQAVKAGVIKSNPADMVDNQKKIRVPESQRVYLTIDEVRSLMDTECKSEISKRAFMFSCFCGLRISDVRRLRWDDIESVTDDAGGQRYRLSVVMKKTEHGLSFMLSDEALGWMPDRKTNDVHVFGGLPAHSYLNKVIKDWARRAGIKKNVSFHTARHTFATMMLTLGADLYTTSKLLGHTNISVTQVYAKIIDKKKDEAMGLIDKFFK